MGYIDIRSRIEADRSIEDWVAVFPLAQSAPQEPSPPEVGLTPGCPPCRHVHKMPPDDAKPALSMRAWGRRVANSAPTPPTFHPMRRIRMEPDLKGHPRADPARTHTTRRYGFAHHSSAGRIPASHPGHIQTAGAHLRSSTRTRPRTQAACSVWDGRPYDAGSRIGSS